MDETTIGYVARLYQLLGILIAYSFRVCSTNSIIYALTFTAIVLAIDAAKWKDGQPRYVISNYKRRIFI